MYVGKKICAFQNRSLNISPIRLSSGMTMLGLQVAIRVVSFLFYYGFFLLLSVNYKSVDNEMPVGAFGGGNL